MLGNPRGVNDSLRATHQENLDPYNELSKSLQEGFFVADGDFESVLKQLKFFYSVHEVVKNTRNEGLNCVLKIKSFYQLKNTTQILIIKR